MPERARKAKSRSPLGVKVASETDALSARPVEKLQELANEFSRVKDLAQSRGVHIPPSYSQFSDIRDRASLQTNTELLQERIRQLNKSIASGGAPPPEGADEGEVIPFVDPVIPQPQVPQPPVPQNPNMFDQPDTGEIEQLTEEMEAIQILENLKARVKDDNLSIEQKLQFASDANQAIQNLLDNLIARNAPDDDKDRIKKALNFVNNIITDLTKEQEDQQPAGNEALKKARQLRKFVKQEDTVARASTNEDVIRSSFANIVEYYDDIKIILDPLPAGPPKDKVKQYAREVSKILDLLDIRIKGFPQPDTGGGEQPVDPPGSAERPGQPLDPAGGEDESEMIPPGINIDDIRSSMADTSSSENSVIKEISDNTTLSAQLRGRFENLVKNF